MLVKKTQPRLIFLALLTTLFTYSQAIAESKETLQGTQLKIPSSNAELKQLLVGKWKQLAWFHPLKKQYEDYPEPSNVHKLYTVNNEFFFFDYGVNGELYTAYGGTFEILAPNKVRETITFYAPYKHTTGRPENGQLALYSGKTMVNSLTTYTVEIDLEKNRLFLSGILKQNTKNMPKPERYADRYLNNGYIKLHSH